MVVFFILEVALKSWFIEYFEVADKVVFSDFVGLDYIIDVFLIYPFADALLFVSGPHHLHDGKVNKIRIFAFDGLLHRHLEIL